MMKILILNPQFHESLLEARLKKAGVSVIICEQVAEADLVLKLHGHSISLVMAHDDPGVQLNDAMKKNPRSAGIPVVLTLSAWTPKECAAHQATSTGANAYVKWPADDDSLLGVIDEVMGTTIAQGQTFGAGERLKAPTGKRPLAAVPSAPEPEAVLTAEPLTTPIGLELGFSDPAVPAADEKTGPILVQPIEAAEPALEAVESSGGGASPLEAAMAALKGSIPTPVAEPAAVETIDFGTSQPEPEAVQPVGDGITIAAVALEDPTSLFSASEVQAESGMSIDIPLSLDLDLGEPPVIESSGPPVASVESPPEPTGMAPTEELSLASAALGTATDPALAAPVLAAPDLGAALEAPSLEAPSLEAADLGAALEASSLIAAAPVDDSMNGADGPLPDFSLSPSSPSISAPRKAEEEDEDIDSRTMEDMPYLSKRGLSPLAHRHPVDDAVVPGGAAQAPDEDTLKRYLQLREQDVAALSAQFRQAKEQVARLEQELRQERAINSEFAHLAQEQDRRIHDFEREKALAVESVFKETEELRFEMKRKVDKMKLLELQVRDATGETEKLKERVRADIRKIRLREKELENRLEIMKKDSEALLGARENKIIELKRKLDLLEFNLDLLQDQYEKEKSTNGQLREKLLKAAQVVRVAGGLLHNEAGLPEELAAAAGSGGAIEEGKTEKTSAA